MCLRPKVVLVEEAGVWLQITALCGRPSLMDPVTEWQVLAGLPPEGAFLEEQDNSQPFQTASMGVLKNILIRV